MKYDIVIPSLVSVTKPYLRLCVESLRASGFDGRIIVVTNGTKAPESLDIPGISQRLHTSAKGQCIAVNVGAQMATADYIFIPNDDMYFAPGWDKNLRFDDLCFSPNLIEPIDNSGSAPPFLRFDGGLFLDKFNKSAVDEFVKQQIELSDPKQEDGFNLPLFIRKDVWDTIGGYDVIYDPGGSNSDTDLETKILLAGIQPKRYRDVLVYHFSNKIFQHTPAWQFNWDYYTEKWGFNRDEEPVPDVWGAKGLVNKKKNIYHPEWEGKYNEPS
jgi:glycosyltransferase involved in cell wall biosynthesis